MIDSNTMMKMIIRLAYKYKKQFLSFFKPGVIKKLEKGAEYRQKQKIFNATNYLLYIDKIDRPQIQRASHEFIAN